MRRYVRGVAGAIVAVAVASGTSGCATGGNVARGEAQGISVRLPPAEAMEFDVQAPRRAPPPAPPLSVADEYQDRWLTLFEVRFQPIEASGLQGAGEGAP